MVDNFRTIRENILPIILILSVFICFCLACLSSCSGPISPSSYTVNSNISNAANNFEVCRRVTVYNARTDSLIFTVEGFISLSNNSHQELIITCMVSEDSFYKHYVYLNENVLYVVEDLSGSDVPQYHHKYYWHNDLFPEFEVVF